VTYEQTCPRCGQQFAGDDPGEVADEVVQHATSVHRHALDREIVLAHLEGVRPDERGA
jgi:predicted small metal-binding protein